MTLFEFYQRYINLNLNDYSNIRIDLEINKILLVLTVGIVVASIFVNYNRYLIATLVKKLARHKAADEASAKTLSELGLSGVRGLSRMLENNGQLRRLVAIVGEESITYEEYVASQKAKRKEQKKDDYTSKKLYIKDEQRCAQISAAPAPTLLSTALFLVLVVAISICLTFLMPEIISVVNNLLAL